MDTIEMKKWWESKTIWFADVLVYLGFMLEVSVSYEQDIRTALQPYLGNLTGIIIIAIGVTVRILRYQTNKGIEK